MLEDSGNSEPVRTENGNRQLGWREMIGFGGRQGETGSQIATVGSATGRPRDGANSVGDVTDSKILDVKKLLELSISIKREIQALQDKDVTLVIGKTGCGKSTLINYLLKKKLMAIEDESGEVYFEIARLTTANGLGQGTSSDDSTAKIGHEFVSETLYPRGFETNRGFLLCDTPGFKDNRSSENDAATYLALQMLIKNAARIKGIIVVLSINDFKERAAGLNETLSLLERLISPNENYVTNYRNAVVFVFTHADDSSGKVKTVKQIQNLLKKAQSGLQKQIAEDPYNEGLVSSLALCHILLFSGVNIVVFDPINEQRDNKIKITGRDRILNFMERSIGIPKEDIAFRVETIFQRYSDAFCQIAKSFLISRMTIGEEQSRIQEYRERIDDIKKSISVLEENNADLERCGKEHKGLEAELKKTEDKIALLREKIDRLNEHYKDTLCLKEEIENDSTLTLVHTANVYLENDVYGVVQKGEIKYHTFNYSQSFPIADVEYKGGKYNETEGSSQDFSRPSYNSDRTRVKIEYTGPSHEYGSAEFKVYSEKRFTPDSKCQISLHQEELKSTTRSLDELNSDLNVAKNRERNISSLKLQAEAKIAEKSIEFNNTQITEYKEKEEELNKKLNESCKKIDSATDILMKEKSQYEMLIQFHDIAPFEEKTIGEFIAKYKDYVNELNFTGLNI